MREERESLVQQYYRTTPIDQSGMMLMQSVFRPHPPTSMNTSAHLTNEERIMSGYYGNTYPYYYAPPTDTRELPRVPSSNNTAPPTRDNRLNESRPPYYVPVPPGHMMEAPPTIMQPSMWAYHAPPIIQATPTQHMSSLTQSGYQGSLLEGGVASPTRMIDDTTKR